MPGLIGASVWIALVIEKPLGESISRPRAETIPAVARVVESERVADRDHGVADLEVGGVAEGKRLERAGVGVGVEESKIGRGVGADHLGVDRVAVLADRHPYLVGALDDVGVGEHMALLVEDEAGPGRGARPLRATERLERGLLGAGHPIGLDVDDAGGGSARRSG